MIHSNTLQIDEISKCEAVLKVHELHEFTRNKEFPFSYSVDYQNNIICVHSCNSWTNDF